MKKILFFFLILPALASAQTAKDTVNVLSDAEISQGTARDSLKFYYVEGAWKKLRLDSIAKYTRVKLVGDKGDITVSNNGDTWSIDAGAVVWEDLAQAVKDSIGAGGGGGGGGVISITAGTGLTGGTITTSGTIAADTNFLITVNDTASMLAPYLREADTLTLSNRINLKLNISDTTAMLAPYLREADTLTLSNRINLKLNISDTTAMLAPYLREADTLTLSNRINLKLNISDTTAMLAPYLKEADTLTLSNRINLKLNISDTTAMLAPYLREADTLTLSNRINLKQNILIAGTGITISNDTISSTGSGGVADGDKGDIDVTSSGTVWTIDAAAVTGLKIASTTVTGDKLAITGISGDAAHLVGAISGGNADTVRVGAGLRLSSGELRVDTMAMIIACSDETTNLTTGTAKVTFRAPFAFTILGLRANVNTAPTGSTIIVDINEEGNTIMTTNKLSIDASEKTSVTAATAAGITDSAIADDAEMTIDIDQIGSTAAGVGLKVTILYRKN